MAYLTFYNPYYVANRDENKDSGFEKFSGKFNGHNCGCVPATNVYETDQEYRLEMALPGVRKEDIGIKYENGLLRISVEEKKDENIKYDHREFDYSGMSRVFKTGDRINTDQISAAYENGLLILTLPKKEAYIKKPAQEIAVH